MTKSVRDSIRANIFKNHEGKKKVIKLFGQEVELHQPKLRDILSMQKKSEQGLDAVFVSMLVECCYVPGTKEKVFDETDKDLILNLPTGEWTEVFNKALEELTSVRIEEAEKN